MIHKPPAPLVAPPSRSILDRRIMLSRVLTALVAIVFTGVAITVPIMLTEAGSRSAVEYEAVEAIFAYADPITGEVVTVILIASDQRTSNQTTGVDDSQTGGSSRARSLRPGQSERPKGGNSDRAHGNERTANLDQLEVFVTRNFGPSPMTFQGVIQPTRLWIAADLSSAHLTATIDLSTPIRPGVTPQRLRAAIDLEFTATGPLDTDESSSGYHVKSPRQSFSSESESARRDAIATGVVEIEGLNLAQDGSTHAVISSHSSKTVEKP